MDRSYALRITGLLASTLLLTLACGSILAPKALSQNNSLDFNEPTDNVTVGSNAAHLLLGDLTLAAWVRVRSLPASGSFGNIIVRSADGETPPTNVPYWLSVAPDGNLEARHESGNGSNNAVASVGTVPLDTWVHVAQVRDATAKTYQLFINGIPEAPVTYTSNPTDGSATSLGFGRWADTGLVFDFDGLIDEVQIWNRKLTQAELMARMFTKLNPATETGLVGYWPMDEGSGAITSDDSDSGNDGTISGATWSIEGNPMVSSLRSLDFDAPDDQVAVGTDAAHLLHGDLTLSAWIKVRSFPAQGSDGLIVVRSAEGETPPTNVPYWLSIDEDGNLEGRHESGNGTNHVVVSTGTVPMNTWVHVAQVRDATAKTYQHFFNGIPEALVAYASNPEDGSGTSLGFGRWRGTGLVLNYDGLIDEVQIWNRSLTQAEIMTRLFTKLNPASETGLVGYWPMDEGTDTLTVDFGDGNNPGTLIGATWNTEGGAFFEEDIPLSVEMTGFSARRAGASVLLTWRTVSEANNAGFDVQQEHVGQYTSLGFVGGAGTTTEPRTYRYLTGDVGPGTHRFRLRQIDVNGMFQYSPVVAVNIDLPAASYLSPAYPNPFNPQTSFTLLLKQPQPVRIAIFDVLGREVARLHDDWLTESELHTFRIDGRALPSGLYHYAAQGPYFREGRTVLLVR